MLPDIVATSNNNTFLFIGSFQSIRGHLMFKFKTNVYQTSLKSNKTMENNKSSNTISHYKLKSAANIYMFKHRPELLLLAWQLSHLNLWHEHIQTCVFYRKISCQHFIFTTGLVKKSNTVFSIISVFLLKAYSTDSEKCGRCTKPKEENSLRLYC